MMKFYSTHLPYPKLTKRRRVAPAVEFLRMSFSHDVKPVRNGRVDADGKVVVDDVARNRVKVGVGGSVRRGAELNLPAVHPNGVAVANVMKNLLQVLTFVACNERNQIPIK